MSTAPKQVRSADSISREIVGAAMKVHTAVGPGLLESAYEAFVSFELKRAGLDVRAQVGFPVTYEGVRLELGYRVDLLVENLVIVELKCVELFFRSTNLSSSPIFVSTTNHWDCSLIFMLNTSKTESGA